MKYYIIAGEASGDLHGSNLVKEIKKLDTEAKIRGWGGDLLKGEGVNVIKHYKDHNFMGFWEVIINLRTILKNISFCKKDISNYAPDALILIDFPGFNMRIAKYISTFKDIPVLYFIAPQVWAWKESRVKQIKSYIHKLFVILPFEKEFFKKHKIEAHYNGHPLVEHIDNFIKKDSINRNEFYEKHQLNQSKEIITLLPGSRKQEIEKKLPLMLDVCDKYENEYNIVIGGISHFEKIYQKYTLKRNATVIYSDTYNTLKNSNVALVTSGTATLETAFFEVPQIVCYKSSWISYIIAKNLVKVDFISLVNLILKKEAVKELIQNDLNHKTLSIELNKLIHNAEVRTKVISDYKALKNICKGENVSRLTATEMLKTIGL